MTSSSAPSAEHRVEPRVDALRKLRPIGSEEQACPFVQRQRRRRAGAEERGERAPGRGQDFERAQNPLAIGRRHARRGFGIARRKLGMELRRRAPLRIAPHVGAQSFGHGGHFRQAFGQRAKIEARAADKNDRPLPRFGENVARRPRPSADRIIDRAVDFAEQAMRRLALLVRRRPRGQNPQVRVDLHRIRIDDRSAETFGELERRRRLAARCRACDEERAPHPFPPPSGSCMPSSAVVATLIANPDRLRLSDAHIKRAAQGVAGFESWRWLDEGVAADLFFRPRLRRSAPRSRRRAPASRSTSSSSRSRFARSAS